MFPIPKTGENTPPSSFGQIGWGDAVLARETADGLQRIDGHLRAEISPDAEVPPGLIVGFNEDEANKLLAVHDPLTPMGETNSDKLNDLLADLSANNLAVQELFESLAEQTEASFQQISFTLPDA